MFLDLCIDWRVLGFTALVCGRTALLFGVAPALRASRVSRTTRSRSSGRGIVGDGRFGLGNLLVVVQVALSLMLLVAAGLFMRTFSSLAHLNLGFDRNPDPVANVNALRTRLEPASDRICTSACGRQPPRSRRRQRGWRPL